MYNANLKYKWDNQNVRDYAEETALKKGIELGQEKERIKSLNEKREIIQKMALKMKSDDLPIAQIVKFTDLSVEEIEKL